MIRIDDEFKKLIPTLHAHELAQLVVNVEAEGIRDPLVVWHTEDQGDILLDGHNRYAIAQERSLKYKTVSIPLANRDEAKIWIIYNQFGRRNMSSAARALLAIKLKPLLAAQAKGRQGTRTDLQPGNIVQNSAQCAGKTRDQIAAVADVSHDTIARVEFIEKNAPPELMASVMSGEVSINEGYTTLKRKAKEEKREATREANHELVNSGKSVPLATLGRYPTIVLDPPWDWGDEGDDNQFGRATPTYDTMPYEEVLAMPVGDLAERNAHIYLWITNRSLPKGFALLEAWGFRYVTMLTWCKPSIGMGNYFRGSTEHILFGVRGSLPLLENNQGTWFSAKRGKRHSEKPDEFYDLVERCSPGPWLDMFSRRDRAGWAVWGAETT